MNLSSIYYLHEIGGKKTQEDYIWPQPGTATAKDSIFIVCDGVGGSENGEIASRIVAEFASNTLTKIPADALSTETINTLLAKAQQKLVDYARAHGLNSDMATTFCLLVLTNRGAFIAWCGDSRVYHIRNGMVLYKTSDHSLVNTLIKKGELTEDEASNHPQKNVILKAIKADYSPIEAEAKWITEIQKGDYFMLCTDGVLENITDQHLHSLLKSHNGKPVNITDHFQELCYNKTRDNYSMYLLQIEKNNDTPAVKHKRKKVWTFLFMFCIVAAVIVTYYLSRFNNKQKQLPDNVIKLITDTSFVTQTDTSQKKALPPFEKVLEEKVKDSAQKKLPAFTIIKKDTTRTDSVAMKLKHPPKKKTDSIPPQKTPTEKQTDSLEKPTSN